MITQVTPHLYRGPRPKSFDELKPLGIEFVLNLQSGAFEFFNSDLYENEDAREFEMIEMSAHFSDFTPPRFDAIVDCLEMLEKVREAKGIAYVHCLHGKDRTGFVVACYRMKCQNWTFEKARDEMFVHGFHKFPYVLWLPTLKRFAKIWGKA